ncbi:MAG: helix-turn-helix domain-containing protein [Bacteroidetes bacterium]|nr:helix-turn-helix domain-containing protein [Bacteroidota bacterium]
MGEFSLEFVVLSVAHPNQRIIFGLKVKQLRQAKGLSFSDLSAKSGISVSYLNEIEKGKKYPKADRIAKLAEALDTNSEHLISSDLTEGLAPVGELIKSNFLSELPLDLFGIEKAKVVEIIANAPKRVGAFISTLVDLARNYQLGEESFYFGALRSYLEMHHNYFAELEQEVETFSARHRLHVKGLIPVELLQQILEKEYGYEIIQNGLDAYPELSDLRSVYLPEKKRLLLNGNLTSMQQAFQLGKELGFQALSLKDRANTSSLLRATSFDEVLSHFKAGYFSAALLLPRQSMIHDLSTIFSKPQWSPESLLHLLNKYGASPEMLFQRMTNLLPQHFGLKKLYLIRMIHDRSRGSYRIDKELHLEGRHNPHENGLYEHYCRRWLSVSMIQKLEASGNGGILAGIQRSTYYGTEDSFLSFTIARPAYQGNRTHVSITIGLAIDDNLKNQIKFWNDPAIPERIVNNTCERCPVKDCAERVSDPHIVNAKNKRKDIQRKLEELRKNGGF